MTENKEKLSMLNRLVLAAFCFSGAAALIYEVAWIRSLSHVLGSTTYAVSTMLSAFMAGLALGGYVGGQASVKSKNLVLLFGLFELGIGAFGLLTIPVINSLSPIYFLMYNRFHMNPDVFFCLQFIVCFAIMVVPTTLMGATFPVVTKVTTSGSENIGTGVGRAYSVNTLGAIAGSIAAGFILIPFIGIKSTVQTAAWINLVVGLVAVVASGAGKSGIIGSLGVIVIFGLNFVAGKSEPRPYPYNYYIANRDSDFVAFTSRTSDYQLLFNKDDPHGTVQVYYRPSVNTMFVVNGGKTEGSTGADMETMMMLAYFPLATNPGAKNVLGIGLGSGMTLRAVRNHIEDVDWVEINPAMITAVRKYFYPDLMESGVNLIVDDARNFLQTTSKKYDVIISQPSFPIIPASANLYTQEFFEVAAGRLAPGGVFAKWFPYQVYSNDSIRIMIKTFTSVFPHVAIWRTVLTGDLVFVGSKTPFKLPLREVSDNVTQLNDYDFLIRYTVYKSPEDVALLEEKLEFTAVNTDDRPILEFRGARNFIKPVDRKPGDRYRL